MRPPDQKRKTPPVEGGVFQSANSRLDQIEHSTIPAPGSMPQPPNVATLDLFDATRISGRGPSACLALITRYGIGALIQSKLITEKYADAHATL